MVEYKKPKPNKEPTGENGYPEKGVNKGITRSTMRGGGAATKGKQYTSQINLRPKVPFKFGW
jgi:hypothetical protein